MDHLLSLLNRLTALLEELQREREVTLRLSSLNVIRRLVATFCDLAVNVSEGAKLQPPPIAEGLGRARVELFKDFRVCGEIRSEISSDELEGDTLSIPDSLPDLLDEEEGGYRPYLLDLVQEGVIFPGSILCQDRIRVNRVWLY